MTNGFLSTSKANFSSLYKNIIKRIENTINVSCLSPHYLYLFLTIFSSLFSFTKEDTNHNPLQIKRFFLLHSVRVSIRTYGRTSLEYEMSLLEVFFLPLDDILKSNIFEKISF